MLPRLLDELVLLLALLWMYRSLPAPNTAPNEGPQTIALSFLPLMIGHLNGCMLLWFRNENKNDALELLY